MRPAIVFDRVSKRYNLRAQSYQTFREDLVAFWRRLNPFGRHSGNGAGWELWALKDVSFEVKPGEALGIIGPNGAGKSTILKLVAGITRPTSGRIDARGKVASLIELGAGFHPELTGRENVYLNGSIFGMREREIEQKFGEIVEFAGISEFIDVPVKRYSSGMQARLGFSIATHVDPEVLLVDEVLGVGDMAFQAKCIERMKEFKRRAVAIVFISHNLQAVSMLCDRAILLRRGEVVARGSPAEAIREYSTSQARGFEGRASLLHAELMDTQGSAVVRASPGEELRFAATVKFLRPGAGLKFGFEVYELASRTRVYAIESANDRIGRVSAGEIVRCELAFRAHLLRGIYEIVFGVFDPVACSHWLLVWPAAQWEVTETFGAGGIADLEGLYTIRRCENDLPAHAMGETR